MATIKDLKEHKNSMIFWYSSLKTKPNWEGEKPWGCVIKYYHYLISASIFHEGFECYKNSFDKIKKFKTLKEAKNFIIEDYNKTNTLF